jgi:hypothetical protein
VDQAPVSMLRVPMSTGGGGGGGYRGQHNMNRHGSSSDSTVGLSPRIEVEFKRPSGVRSSKHVTGTRVDRGVGRGSYGGQWEALPRLNARAVGLGCPLGV